MFTGHGSLKSSSSVAFGGTFGQVGVDSTWFNIEISFIQDCSLLQITSNLKIEDEINRTPSAEFQDIPNTAGTEARDTAVTQCYQSLTLRQQQPSTCDIALVKTRFELAARGKSSSLGGG